MKRIILIALLLLTVTLTLSAANQVVSSKKAAAFDAAGESYTLVKQESYTSQLGNVTPAAMPDRTSAALGNINYPVTVGDVYTLSYTVSGATIELPLLVTHSQTVTVPSVGTISTEGKTYMQLKDAVEKSVTSYYPYSNPVLTLTKTGVFSVYVSGEVYASRYAEAWGLTRLSDLIALATDMASTRSVTVRNASGEKTYDLYRAVREGDENENPILRNGDSVIFSRRDTLVTVGGAVNRPGSYQILEGEGVSELLSSYAGGFASNADIAAIVLRRYENGAYTERVIPADSDIELEDSDIIYVTALRTDLGSVSVEGALLNKDTGTQISGNASASYYFRFAEGDTVRDLVEGMSDYFISASDLSGVYLIRNGENIALSFSDILYGNDETGSMMLKSGDRFIIPFNQLVVNVIGAVNKSGVFGYVPGKNASYYITLAGGLSTDSKGPDDYTVRDKYGNKLKNSDPVPSEAVIEVERDNFVRNLQPAVAVIGIVSSVLAIVSATLAIVAPSIY
ncbi:MAG: SLBB domain-containing protein [Bullifex sp.]